METGIRSIQTAGVHQEVLLPSAHRLLSLSHDLLKMEGSVRQHIRWKVEFDYEDERIRLVSSAVLE